MKNSDIRLQWDPDHDPLGAKLERRAIQIGIRGSEIERFSKEDIMEIEDISDYVKQQHEHVLCQQFEKLMLPKEEPIAFEDDVLNNRLKLST